MSSNLMALSPGDIDVWLLRTRIMDAADRELCSAYVSGDEWAKAQRFVTRYLQDQFLQSRAMMRVALSFYVSVMPQDWEFVTNSYGRPFVAPHLMPSEGIHFSLSHTQDLMALSISRNQEVGIDVECREREIDYMKIARAYFSPHECKQLEDLSPGSIGLKFWSFWTLKEAFIKAKSMGMAIPLDAFGFDLASKVPLFSCDESRLGHSSCGWKFRLMKPTERHVLALCQGSGMVGEGVGRLRLIKAQHWTCGSMCREVILNCSLFE